jgi:FtsP/CotA-like multicopper oxidase with cupredoxin domain
MNRREMLKFSILTGSAVMLFGETQQAWAESHPTGGIFDPPSPPVTNPFTVKLPRMPLKTPLPGGISDLSLPENGGVAPNGTVYPQVTGNDALTTYMNSLERIVAAHQRNSANNVQFSPQKFYLLDAVQATHVFHSDPPYNKGSIVWGYDGIFPGPTFESRYGVPILVRIHNGLYDDPEANPTEDGKQVPGGFGSARISTHLHNGHTGSESDGNPTDFYPPEPPAPHLPPYPESVQSIRFRDHHYPMFRAGLDPRVPSSEPAPNKDDGDPAETVSTLWYHDHSMDHTAENVYKGLVGFHLFFDEVDSGDENDSAPTALRLPSGDFDIPLLFQDKRFDCNGELFLPSRNEVQTRLGVLGDRFTVNGIIQPKLIVQRRRYRFRFLNAGPSRFYQFFLTLDDNDQEYVQIGNDESLFENALNVTSVLLSPAERGDVVIDFGRYTQGQKLILVNRLKMENNGFGPLATFDGQQKFQDYVTVNQADADRILCFEIGGDAADPSLPPGKLRDKPCLPEFTMLAPDELKALGNHRSFEFSLDNSGTWVVNGRPFDPSPAGATHQNDSAALLPVGKLMTPRTRLSGEDSHDGEVWTIKNVARSAWSHPVHIHLEEFHILWRDGKPPRPYEKVKKDVLSLAPNEEVQIYIRFRDFLGKYPIHCHNVLHEDHEMMIRFDVVGDY